MKIALVSSSPVPAAFGGMDRLLEGLRGALAERHPTDLVTLPVDERSAEGCLRGYYEFYHLDLSAYDLAISYKAPAYMVRHPVQVLYLSHRMRVFYDLYEPRGSEHARLRRLVHWLDGWALAKQRIPFVFCVGNTVSKRLLRWGGIESTPIHHPSTFRPDAPKPGEHLLSVGRLHEWKRIDLIVRALRESRADLPLKIVGTGPQEAQLRELAGGDPRIEFLGLVSEERLRDLYARALVTIFPPINEDLGLITLESFAAAKPVLTTTDSGEPAEIVRHEQTGFIEESTAAALARRFEWIAAHRGRLEEMGEACLAAAAEVTWDRLVGRLLGAAEKTRAMQRGAGAGSVAVAQPAARAADEKTIRLLVTDNQIIDPPVGGGRLRIYELYRNLPADFETTYLGTHDYPGPEFRDQWLAPNFREIVMPLTPLHFKLHEIWRRLTRGDATVDVTIPVLLGRASPRFKELIGSLVTAADMLICAHPWVMPCLPDPEGLPRVYDSHNCEAAVKAPMLRRTLAGRYLARVVEKTERLAITTTELTLACCQEDADQFGKRYGANGERVVVIPNGADCRRIRPGAAADKPALRAELGIAERPLALFVASHYGPNDDAADFLIDTLAPRLPGLTIGIVGGVGTAWRERNRGRKAPANVHLFGIVEHETLPAIYAAADIGLNPMRHGSGTNIKMLDYMAAGLAIVTTAIGARGLSGKPDEHWILTDEPGFGPALEALLASPERRGRLGAGARRLAETDYDWPIISGKLAEALRKLVHKKPSV